MCIGQEGFELFMQQGTGKTPICIARICFEARQMRKKTGKMLKVLVVCPRQARSNWANEIERFAVVPGKVVVLRGGKIRRVRGIVDTIRDEKDCDFGVCICSYESIEKTWDAMGAIPWDLVILDESHYIKNPNAQRSKACRRMNELTGKRMVLTGTPIGNSVMDLWSQMEFTNSGMSGFMTYNNFRKFYGVFEKRNPVSGFGVEKLTGMKNLPLIQERLVRTSFSITKKEANLNLPEKVYDVYEVGMSARGAEFYAQLQKQLAIEIQQAQESKTCTAEHILTRLLRLAQITSGHVKWDNEYDEEGNEIAHGKLEQIDLVNTKTSAIIDILKEEAENDNNCKTIIWCTFVEDIRVVSAALDAEGIKYAQYYGGVPDKDRDEMVRKFNFDPEVKVFIGNPQSAGEALNLVGYDWNVQPSQLQTYTGRMVFFSQNWSMIQRSQAEDRAHRRGTRQVVRIADLQVPGTIDEEIRACVHLKRFNANSVQDVSKLLDRVLNNKVEADE
jgi:SNF2 family DNA or RNA helicase